MPFTVSTDGSNDDGSGNKQFLIVVRTFDQHDVRSDVLAIPVCKGSATGENIFRLLDDEFEKNGVSWLNCISLGCDNAKAKKGVFAFCKAKHPNIFLAGCTLHLVHIAAEKGAESLGTAYVRDPCRRLLLLPEELHKEASLGTVPGNARC